MTELYYSSGIENDYQTIIEKFGDPDLYWYEPKPESLLDSEESPPLTTLKKGEVTLPDKVEFSEMLLFYSRAALTIVKQMEGYKYFYCSEEDSDNTDKSLQVEKQTTKAIGRDAENLIKQFGIEGMTLSDDYKLTIWQHNNQCIGWTISDASGITQEGK